MPELFDPNLINKLLGIGLAETTPLLKAYRENQRDLLNALGACSLGTIVNGSMVNSEVIDGAHRVSMLAHRLKSAARSIGAVELASVAEQLEVACAERDTFPDTLLQELIARAEALDLELAAFLEGSGSQLSQH